MYYDDAKVIKTDYSGSFLVHSDELGRSLWMDVWIEDGEILCDWNKYIFFTNDSNDMEEMRIQSDCETFESFSSAAIEYFESCNVVSGSLST